MKKILFTLAAVMIMLTASLATQATAAPKGGFSKSFTPAKGISNPNLLPKNANLIPKTVFQPAKTITTTNLMKTTTTTNLMKMNNVVKTQNLNVAKVSNFNLTKATKFSQGFMYHGKNHFHWSIQRWDARYGCNCYYDPYILGWFYWCQPDLCYYPITYVPYQSYCCWNVPTPVVVATTSCLPCEVGLSSAVGVASVAGTTGVPMGVPVEPIEGTQEPPITTAGDDAPPIPDPVMPLRKQ